MTTKHRVNPPIYQRAIQFAAYILFGLVAAGTLLDAFSNAFTLITPSATYIGTVTIIAGGSVAAVLIRRFSLRWISKGGKVIRLKRLGVQLKLALLGMIILLWVPRLTDKDVAYSRLQVHVEAERNSALSWGGSRNIDRSEQLSDLVTISRNGTILAMYSLMNIGNSSRFKDYPTTMNLFEQPSPTNIEPYVLDLDNDGNDEVVLKVTNKEQGLHADGFIACLILNSQGEVVASAPLPLDLPELPMTNPYSAYRTLGNLVDKKGGRSWPVSYTNYVGIKKLEGKNILLFGWVLDSACFMCPHVQQIDAYIYEQGQLVQINDHYMFWYSTYPKEPAECNFTEFSTDVEQLVNFLGENNLPSLKDMIENFRERRENNKLKK